MSEQVSRNCTQTVEVCKMDSPTAELCPEEGTEKCSETETQRQEVKTFSLNCSAYLLNESLSCPSGK